MSKKRIGNSKAVSGQGQPPEDGKVLWDTVTKDIAPLKPKKAGKPAIKAATPKAKSTVKNQKQSDTLSVMAIDLCLKPVEMKKKPNVSSTQMSAQQKKRHQAGDLPIEGKIDLHGKTLEAAFHSLKSFILRSYTGQKRNLLVITGKGRTRADGMTIRQSFPRWLQDDIDIAARILSFSSAQPKDGGDGAWYILLRRQRNKD